MAAKDGNGPKPARFVLSDRQRLAWLRLYRSDNVGPATFRDLITHCGSAEAALEMLPELARRGGQLRSVRIASDEEAERELEAVARYGARIVGFGEPDFPPMLRRTENAPPLVTIKGNPEVFRPSAVGIVGARNASMSGIRIAQRLSRDLGEAGHVIVSGLARGIDHAAHEAAVSTGTIAVLAGGIDKPYPPENLRLLDAIENGAGAAITDRPFGLEARARDFPRRNRIIAALSLGLVVVEAAMRSGSLITARLANELGRLVFAVPGSPLDPRAEGTNTLLKNGAIVTTSAKDILEALAPLDDRQRPGLPDNCRCSNRTTGWRCRPAMTSGHGYCHCSVPRPSISTKSSRIPGCRRRRSSWPSWNSISRGASRGIRATGYHSCPRPDSPLLSTISQASSLAISSR